MLDKSTYHHNHLDALETKIKEYNNQLSTLVKWRLAIFVVVTALSIYLWKESLSTAIILINIGVLLFFYLLRKQSGIERKKAFYSNLEKVHIHEIKILNQDFKDVDTGAEYQIEYHNYSHDLDIFGVNSIYQILNRCATYSGKKKLAHLLNHTFLSKEEILSNQTAVNELSEKESWCYDFLAYGKGASENAETKDSILHWLASKNYFDTTIVKTLKIILPLITVIIGILSIFSVLHWVYITTAFLLNLLVTVVYTKKINKTHNVLSSKYAIIHKFEDLIKSIENQDFKSEFLKSSQQKILVNKNNSSASKSLEKLGKLLDLLDARLNIYMAVLLNGLFLWDIHNVSKVEAWKAIYKEDFKKWIDIVGDFDLIVSIALFRTSNPAYVFPEILEKGFKINSIAIGHPLISKEKMISNDYQIEGNSKVDLLTGANMAGKSTFLRTLGVNLVLGMIGAPVCAEKLEFTPTKLYTSLRTIDSLQENESFFYAELKRLKKLITLYQKDNNYFFLFDEILKGTNSKDQHTGSLGLIQKIISLNGQGIIATHDLELSVLEKELPKHIRNFSFEVAIENDKLLFDYKLKRGFCKIMNATHLMKTMEII